MRIFILLALTIWGISAFSQKDRHIPFELLNGEIYQKPNEFIIGHPFFGNDMFYSGNLIYKNHTYDSQLIKYDLLNQNIVLYQQLDSTLPRFITVNTYYLSDFEIHSPEKLIYKFTNKYQTIEGISEKIRYFQILYENKLSYVLGRSKYLQNLVSESREKKYVESYYYFLIINNKATRIKNVRDIYKLFETNKKQIKEYIKENNLEIEIGSNSDLIKLLIFCETLIA